MSEQDLGGAKSGRVYSVMMDTFSRLSVLLALSSSVAFATNVLLTNDDGWAVANIRAQYAELQSAGYYVRAAASYDPLVVSFADLLGFSAQVLLSCPAENKSGTGSDSETPQTLTEPCEYDTCPTGSPAEGYNSSDRR